MSKSVIIFMCKIVFVCVKISEKESEGEKEGKERRKEEREGERERKKEIEIGRVSRIAMYVQ